MKGGLWSQGRAIDGAGELKLWAATTADQVQDLVRLNLGKVPSTCQPLVTGTVHTVILCVLCILAGVTSRDAGVTSRDAGAVWDEDTVIYSARGELVLQPFSCHMFFVFVLGDSPSASLRRVQYNTSNGCNDCINEENNFFGT